MFLLFSTIRKHEQTRNYTRDLVHVSISVCCAITGMSYTGLSITKILSKNSGPENLGWVVLIIRGLIWISLTCSLYVQRTKSLRILSFVWWVCFFSLVSGLNVEILIKREGFEIIDMAQWFVTLLLFFCGLRNLARFKSDDGSSKSLEEPLLPEKSQERASFFSILTFSWINTLLSLGYSKPLNLDDIPSLVADDEASLAYEKFFKSWDDVTQGGKDLKPSENSVIWAISRVYLKETILTGFYALVRVISVTLSPLLLYGFVEFSNRGEEEGDVYKGLVLVGCLVLTKTIDSITQRHWYFQARRSGMRIRSGLMVAIYKKQLRLSSSGRKRHSTGEIVNYIAVDAYRLGEFMWWFHSMWSLTLQLFLGVGLLFALVGVGALPGLVPLVICGLLNVPFAKILQKCQTHFMAAQDERLRLTSEVLSNMKIIKLQSWEDKFEAAINSLRDKEFKWLEESQFKRVYGTLMYWMSPTLISSIVFLGVACLNSNALNASTIFTILATLRCMSEPVRMIPEALSVLIQVKVSLERINAFLIDDELKSTKTGTSTQLDQDTDKSVALTIVSSDFKWDVESSTPTLQDVNLEVKRGQKVAVCGPVGSGKSSLLCAILGEIPKFSGHVRVNGSTAYVAQTSWIQSGTIRENILFGKPMEKNRYEKAIKACALDKDINSFSYGDLTEIGQRGINMSGGQKQRIQLARAVYNDADIYLLDDPFSAVDAHTASTLFNDCVMSALAEKTVILVTRQVEFLSGVDKILVMEGGKVTQSGTYNELLMKGTAFEHLVNAHKNSISSLAPSVDETAPADDQPDEISSSNVLLLERVQLTDDEEMETGDVGWKPFWDYVVVSKGTSLLCSGFIAHLFFIALQAISTYWMALAIQVPSINHAVLIGVYAVTSSASTIFAYLRSLFHYKKTPPFAAVKYGCR